MKIFVTVGMNPWPFDRLLQAITPLCAAHELFVQTGVSRISPPCPHQPYLPYLEVLAHIDSADIIVTHAGNTVRLVQRAGKVPIAVARQAPYEMANDHQVEYLRREEQNARIIAVWDETTLPEVVAYHPERQAALLATRTLAAPANIDEVGKVLDTLWAAAEKKQFRHRHLISQVIQLGRNSV